MKKEDLTALGLTDEQIAGVQKLNGLDIEVEKKKVTKSEAERDNYKSQLETATTSLDKFKDVDVDKLNGEIEMLKTTLSTKENEWQSKLADREFNDKLNSLITKAGGRNATSIIANLDINALKLSKNQAVDMQSAIDAFKEKESYMFGANEPYQNPVGDTGNSNTAGITAEQFAKMGYKQRVELCNTNPEKYNELSGRK